ncbi:hypothetical protein DFH94DRAFT_857897 [Russula ochroleuca]|uniref:Uncharacterized protein n=1 Tax=Russula ochroleuca TaxID=152965 RepID=A0A9P5JU49_9AGAM|nr:hypothetical protein DFH94DRAFT_857936 [Russula ochroleuca]KAF8464176.1 hypothetical protein DFH94DRAFT_857897 [Russula ochroleuca]
MAQVFLWILLAGFLILPSSFPNIQTIVKGSGTLTKVLHDVRNAPALVIAFTCCVIGTIGLCVLWWRWSHKYAWLLSTIFIPGMFSGLSGVISTFVGIYGAQEGVHYGVTTIATVAATGGCSVICGFLAAIHVILKRRENARHRLEGSYDGDDS